MYVYMYVIVCMYIVDVVKFKNYFHKKKTILMGIVSQNKM